MNKDMTLDELNEALGQVLDEINTEIKKVLDDVNGFTSK